MKANELMIGDWVHLVKKTPLKGIVETDCMTKIKALPGGIIYTDKEPCEESQLFPIPRTEGIFKANKFRKSGSVFCFADDYYDIIAFELSDSIWKVVLHNNEISLSNEQVFVSHVHQLQNFLNLCGVEKEIAL